MVTEKQKVHRIITCLYGINLFHTNIQDCKGTWLYREKLIREVAFTAKQFDKLLDKTYNPDAAKMERFAVMNRISKIIASIVNDDFNRLEEIENVLKVYKDARDSMDNGSM